MSVLRSINQRLEGMVEGVFGRTFKAHQAFGVGR